MNHMILLLLLLTSTACASSSETRNASVQATVDSLRSLAASVSVNDTFSVQKARAEHSPIAPAFGLLGVLVEATASSMSDNSKAESFSPSLAKYSPGDTLAESLKKHLSQSRHFNQLQMENGRLKESVPPSHGHFTVVLEQWGLRPCLGGGGSEDMQAVVQLEGKLYLPGSDKVVWEREETSLDQTCHLYSAFQSESRLLTESLTRAIDSAAGKLVNEMLYP